MLIDMQPPLEQDPRTAIYCCVEATGLGREKWSSAAAPLSLDEQLNVIFWNSNNRATNAAAYSHKSLLRSFHLFVNGEQRDFVDPDILLVAPKAQVNDTKQGDTTDSFKIQLQNVQKSLGVSITQLSDLLGVTRKSIYDWLEGRSIPRAANTRRLELIADIIRAKSTSLNMARLKGIWNIHINGRSIRDVLADESLSELARREEIEEKLLYLSPRLAYASSVKKASDLGDAHTSDADRVCDLA